MKKLTLITLILTSALIVNAQKIKFKKDQVLVDKNPIASFEGKSSAFGGTDITFKSLDGNPLFTFRDGQLKYFLPTKSPVNYYEIIFHNPSKKIKYLTENTFYSKKKIVQVMFFEPDPKLIEDNTINSDALKTFIKENDASKKLEKDSLDNIAYEKEVIALLENNKISRDLTKPVSINYKNKESFGSSSVTTYQIIQDKKIIGWIENSYKQTNLGTENNFKVLKKLKTPVYLEDKPTNSVFAAYLEVDAFPKLWTMQDKKVIDTKMNSAQQLAEFLVKNGYL